MSKSEKVQEKAKKGATASSWQSVQLQVGKDCNYYKELSKLETELVKLQEWIKTEKLRVVVLFEGRDAAGDGGSARRSGIDGPGRRRPGERGSRPNEAATIILVSDRPM